MFEYSKIRTDEFNDFMKKRNIFDEDSQKFGLNKNSKELCFDVPEKTGLPKPLLLFH